MSLEEKILNLYKKEYKLIREQRVIEILKLVLVDKEIDIDKIINLTSTTITTMKKYISDRTPILKFLTEEEFKVFENEFQKILNLKLEKTAKLKLENKSRQDDELPLLQSIVDEIMNTRHSYSTICINNCYPKNKLDKILSDRYYIDGIFGDGMQQTLKSKIMENGLIRERVPKNTILIEDKEDILVANPNIYYLNQSDFKKLKLASTYLCSGADIDLVMKKFNLHIQTILSLLNDEKLKLILNSECYEKIKRYIEFDKYLVGNTINDKRDILCSILDFLSKNNFEKELAMDAFKLPEPLFDKMLIESLKLPYFNEYVKSEVRNIVYVDKKSKTK